MVPWAEPLFGAGLMILGASLLYRGSGGHRPSAHHHDAAADQEKNPGLTARSMFDCPDTAKHLNTIRVRMGFPVELFEQAVCPVIKAYGEFVQLIPASESQHPVASQALFESSVELARVALDVRRDRILPPGAAPEAIAEHAQRWTYAVFVAALLCDVRRQVAELRTRDGHALPDSLSSSVCSLSARHVTTEHGKSVDAGTDETEYSLQLLRHFVPAAILEWLAEDAALMRELLTVLACEATAPPGAIGALLQRARVEAERHDGAGSRDGLNQAEQLQPPAGATAPAPGTACPERSSKSEQETSAPVTPTADSGPSSVLAANCTQAVKQPEYLEDFDSKPRRRRIEPSAPRRPPH